MAESQRGSARPHFLSDEWSRLVAFASREAKSLGLGCDFTFGSAWPFGGAWLSENDAAKTFDGYSYQRLEGSWESASEEPVFVLDHLSAAALERYSLPLVAALAASLSGQCPAFFCDSLEIHTEGLWSPLLWNEFAQRFGYRLEPFLTGGDLTPYWTRQLDAELLMFFAHPIAETLRYPMRHGISEEATARSLQKGRLLERA